jgi:hypothetical protein
MERKDVAKWNKAESEEGSIQKISDLEWRTALFESGKMRLKPLQSVCVKNQRRGCT